MTADLVNLRRQRKRRSRMADEATAAANRVASGTPRAVKTVATAERDRAEQHFQGHRRVVDQDAPEQA